MVAPRFSVVLPTFNRAADLERALVFWDRQLPRELPFELVVVDDGSTDRTAELLATWSSDRFALRVATQPNSGPAAARNRGLGLASGELVLFTGDDIEPTLGLLAEHWRGHQERDDPRTAILGLTRWPEGDPLTTTMRHVDGVGGEQFSYHGMRDGATYDFRHLYTSNVSLRRALLDREPVGFSTAFPAAAFEDAELGWRLSRHGLRIVYRSAAVAFHHHQYDAASFFRRQVRCGEMAAVLWRLRPHLARWTPLADLEWARLTALGAGWERRSLVDSVAAELPTWEERALALAAWVEHLDGAPAEHLLRALFRYAYVKGLGLALLPTEAATRLAATFCLQLLPAAVARWARQMDRAGLKVPAAELAAIVRLDPARC